MLRQRPVAHPKMWATGIILALAAAGGAVASVVFTNSSVAAAPSAATVRVSVGPDTNDIADGADSNEPAISADGRYVAFSTDQPFSPVDLLAASQSTSGGEAPEPRPDADIYVRDTVANTTALISYDPGGADGPQRPAFGDSTQPTISGDGRFIAFRTTDQRIAKAPSLGSTRILVCDRDADGNGRFDTGCTFTQVSGAEWDPNNPHLSADGRQISYDVSVEPAPVVVDFAPRAPQVNALAGAVGPAPDPGVGWVSLVNLRRDESGKLVPVADAERTTISAPTTLSIGGDPHSLTAQANSTLAAAGGHLTFVAAYENPAVSDEPRAFAVFDYDIASGADPVRLDVDANGTLLAEAGRAFSAPALSGDGRRYAFVDRRNPSQISVRLYDRDPDLDRIFWPAPGERFRVEIASRTTSGTEGLGSQPAFSANGRYLAFTTPSIDMHEGIDIERAFSCLTRGSSLTQSFCDIVVRDIVLDEQRARQDLPRLPATLVSQSARPDCAGDVTDKPCEGRGESGLPLPTSGGSNAISRDGGAVLSADGSAVAFGSAATDLVDDDTNGNLDIFLRRFRPALAGDAQDFGEIPLGFQAIRNVVLRHVGQGPLSVAAVTVNGAGVTDFAVFPGEDCTARVLHAADTCTVAVRFLPTELGARTATLSLTMDGETRSVDLALTGIGVPAPVSGFSATPDGLAFGARGVLRTSPAQVVTVTNPGNGPLQVLTVGLGLASATSFSGDYRIVGNTCGEQVAPGASCRISVRHQPKAVGERPAILAIAYVGTDGNTELTHVVPLTGTGTPPSLKAAPPVAPAGRVTQVTGANYPPGSSIVLAMSGMPGTTRVKADSKGEFKAQLVIMPNTWAGTHALTGDVVPTSAPGLAGPLTATIDFLIVSGTPIPPDYHIRM